MFESSTKYRADPILEQNRHNVNVFLITVVRYFYRFFHTCNGLKLLIRWVAPIVPKTKYNANLDFLLLLFCFLEQ